MGSWRLLSPSSSLIGSCRRCLLLFASSATAVSFTLDPLSVSRSSSSSARLSNNCVAMRERGAAQEKFSSNCFWMRFRKRKRTRSMISPDGPGETGRKINKKLYGRILFVSLIDSSGVSFFFLVVLQRRVFAVLRYIIRTNLLLFSFLFKHFLLLCT